MGIQELLLTQKNIFKNTFCPCKLCQKNHKSKSGQKRKSMTKSQYYERLVQFCSEKSGYVIETEWKTAKTVYHFKCGNPLHPVFESTADSLMNGNHWCPYCSGRKGDFDTKFKEIIEKNNGQKLSKYINSTTPILVQCNKDDYIWNILPSNILKGRWCPVCNMPFTEKVVWDYLQKYHIDTKIQYKFNDLKGKSNEPLKFDFAIFNNGDLKMLLEIDDVEHYFNVKSERRKEAQNRDVQKDNYCKRHNISLYRMKVPFCSWKDNAMSYEEYYDYIHTQLYPVISDYINNKEAV